MTVADHYRTLVSRSSDALEALLNSSEASQRLTSAHNFIADLELLSQTISGRPEAIMINLAARELSFSSYAAAAGKYRHATISLRICLEIAIASVYFSAYEIRLRKWLADEGDIVWSSLMDVDEGVFSKSFIRAFDVDMAEYGRQYAAICKKVYRECSEFVHGNKHTHPGVQQAISFDELLFQQWAERVAAVRTSVLFAFGARYLSILPQDLLNALEGLMIDSLGHLTPIQARYARENQ